MAADDDDGDADDHDADDHDHPHDAHADDDDDHLRVACYLAAPVSHLCHNVTSRRKAQQRKAKQGQRTRQKSERAQVMQRCAAWVWRLSLGGEDLICC